MKKYPIILALCGLLALSGCAPVAASAASKPAAPENSVVTVTGKESVKVTPDVAEIVYGVRTQAADAKTCQEKNTSALNEVVGALKALGVAEKDIQTTGQRLNPQYDWSNNTQKLTGYEMDTSLTVSGLPIGRVGEVLKGSVEAGVNTIDSVSYRSSVYDQKYREALGLAVKSARSKAEAIAAAGGRTLGDLKSAAESSGEQEIRYSNYSTEAVKAAGDAAAAPQMMPGELEVEARVSLEYLIQ